MEMKRVMMNISDIKVSSAFGNSTPKEDKLNRCRQFYIDNGRLDRDIIINERGYIVDGYVGLIVLKEAGVTEAEICMRDNRTTYVFGRHNTCPKEYCWMITRDTKDLDNLKIGNKMVVITKQGSSVALITNIIKSDKPPVDFRVKGVIKCLDE